MSLKAQVTVLRKEVSETQVKNGEVDRLKKEVAGWKMKFENLGLRKEESDVEVWRKKVAYLEGVISGMEVEEMSEYAARIMPGATGGSGLAGGTPTKSAGGGGALSGGGVGSVEKDVELRRVMRDLKEANERVEGALSDVVTLQRQVEGGNEYKKKLQEKLGGLEVDLFKAEEQSKMADRERRKLIELVRDALKGTSKDGGKELQEVVGMTQ